MRRFGAALVLVTLLAPAPAVAKPWWWASFSRGDGTNTSNSEWERWHAFFVASIPSTDTAYVTSFTWGSASIGSIDGINGGNDAGLNSHSAAGFPPDYLIGDNGGTNWANAQALSDADVTDVQDGAGTMHNKDYFGASRGYLISSANHSAGGWRSQNNNSVLFFDTAGMSALMAKVRQEMEEKAGGTFHDNTPYGTINFFSPNGDTVELRFAPDDNDGSLTAGSNSIGGRLATLAQNAKESIFYMVDGWSITGANQLDDKILNNTVAFKAGVAGDASCGGGTDDWTGAVYTSFESNHTLRCEPGAFNRLHTKTMIFDMEIVATGSPNYTFFAMGSTTGNDEAHVIVHDFRLARRYMAHYHKIMAAATADPSADAYDNVAPAGATGLNVTATDTAFYATWTASATTDVSRYYLFIDTAPLTQSAIGDFVDNDADGAVDEDPRGDYDRFPSGTTAAGKTAADDDADGSADEDRWMPPEVMVKGRTKTSAAITSWNVGDTLLAGTNYFFGIVSVDTQGNEGTIATFGPLQLSSPVSDTSLVVLKNSDTGPANARRGETNVVAATLWIRGETTTTGDTLSIFEIESLGLADSQDVTVRLWRDENRDSRVTIGTDTLVSTLAQQGTAKRWRATLAADTRTFLGVGASAGRTFLVVLDVNDTATLGETFQVRVAAQTCSAVRSNSGPASAVTNAGAITIVSANPLDVVLRGDYASASIPKGTTDSPAMSLRVTVATPNDTLQVFRVRNLGTMTSADVTAVKIYHDGDQDSVIDAGPTDTLIATLPFISGAESWGADTIGYRFAGDSLAIIVAIDVSAGATGGRTFRGRIPANSVDAINADTGPPADRTTTAVLSIPSDTAPDTAIVINEFIPSPDLLDHDNDGQKGDTDEEFIELYNNSDHNVDVGNWKLDDDLTPGDVTLPSGLVLGPRQFLVIYNDTQPAGPRWWRYDSAGVVRLETGTFTGTGFALNTTADTVILVNASNVQIDSRIYTTETADSSHARLWDGAETWTSAARPSPGKNADPTAIFNNPSPNAVFFLSASPSTVNEGDSFTLTVTARNRVNQTIAEFNRTAALSTNTGTVTPAATGVFSAGTRSESISITNVTASGSVTITARYNSTTSGTVAVQVNNLVTATFTVDLEARTNESGCSATITGPVTRQATSDAAGNIVFANIPEGTYTFTGKEPHHLRRTVSGVVISGDTTVPIGLMRAGDSNDDNWIQIFDAARVKWFSTNPPGPSSSDIDGDGDVDAADLGWIRQNFGRRGDP